MDKFVIAFTAAASLFLAAAPAYSNTIVYNAPNTRLTNQNWTGTLGLDFTVNAPVNVVALGVFAGSANVTSDAKVVIFDENGAAVSPIVSFLGTLNPAGDAYVFKSVTPFTLGVGNYQLASWGFGTGFGFYNPRAFGGSDPSEVTFNSAGGKLTATASRYNNPGVFGTRATILDALPVQYGSASFVVAAVPEPATWGMMIVGFGMAGVAFRRRKAAVAA